LLNKAREFLNEKAVFFDGLFFVPGFPEPDSQKPMPETLKLCNLKLFKLKTQSLNPTLPHC